MHVLRLISVLESFRAFTARCSKNASCFRRTFVERLFEIKYTSARALHGFPACVIESEWFLGSRSNRPNILDTPLLLFVT